MKSYKGNLPYVFVSYSHADSEVVIPIISELQSRGYRIWFDNGIEAGEEWPEVVANHLVYSESIIFFVSSNFVLSKNCKRELNFAIDKNKDCYAIYLDDAKLSLGTQMQLGTIQSIFYDDNLTITNFISKVISNSVLNKNKLLMSPTEYNEFFKDDIVENSFLNQMIVGIGIIVKDKKILMTKRSNNENGLVWGFPASTIKPSENIKKRLEKEIYTETSIRTKFKSVIGKRIHPDTKVIVCYCEMEYISGEENNNDDYENDEVKWIPTVEYEKYLTSDLYGKVRSYIMEQTYNDVEVVMCIVCKEDNVLLVHRKKNDESLFWAFPGGTVEPGETIFDTAIRELKEETNVDGLIIKCLGARIHPYTKKHMAYVALEPKSYNLKLGDSDLDDIKWVNRKELVNYFGNSPLYPAVAEYLGL